MTSTTPLAERTSWPHRLAWLLAINVFLLICMGGTVTTCESGMAVPDWPTTYSYWWYPVKMWTTVWDIFLEHGHRLLAQLAGITSILLAILLWRNDPRRWMRWIAVLIVLGVIVQGTLGGIRVLADNRLLARVHGCIAPLYFSLCCAVIAWTSKSWRNEGGATKDTSLQSKQRPTGASQCQPSGSSNWSAAQPLLRWSWFLVAAIYVEIVFGAQLRRPSSDTLYGNADLWVWLKVLNAALIAAVTAWLIVRARRWATISNRSSEATGFARRTLWLGGVLGVQLVLAVAAWVANYGWPDWAHQWVGSLPYTVTAQGRLQVFVTTAHAAIGSLTLVAALNLVLVIAQFKALSPSPVPSASTAKTGR